MEIERTPCFDGNGYDFCFIKDGKRLKIIFARVLDLYFIIEDGEVIPSDESKIIDFIIDESDGVVYKLFGELYDDLISGNYEGVKRRRKTIEWQYKDAYNRLVDKDGKITWISEAGITEEMDWMTIEKIDNYYKLSFVRNDKELSFGFKYPGGVSIRITNSGSRYHPYNATFMHFFRKLQKMDEKKDGKGPYTKK